MRREDIDAVRVLLAIDEGQLHKQLVLGHHPLTWALAIAALVAVVISRLLITANPTRTEMEER